MNDDSYKNLIELLKLFKNRPYHLAKYLVDNNALDHNFVDTLSKVSNLDKVSDKKPIHFVSIAQMEEFYLSLIDVKNISEKSEEEIARELNEKLDLLIRSEKYEDAARLRDYMQRRQIKRINKF